MQEDINDEEHEQEGDKQCDNHLLNGCEEELRHILLNGIFQSRGEVLGLILQLSLHVLGYLGGIGTSNLLHHTHHGRLAIVLQLHVVALLTQLYLGYIAQMERLTIAITGQDDVAILLWSLQPSLVSQGVFIGHVALFTDRTRRSLNVLLRKSGGDIGRHQAIGLHLCRVKPDTHRVVGGGRALHIAHTIDTFQCRRHVDAVVVVQELRVIAPVVGSKRVHDDVGTLPFRHRHTRLGHLRRQQSLRLLHTVVHIDGCHIRIGSLLKEDGNLGHSGVACR